MEYYQDITTLIPQRYPFLLIDKIIEYIPQKNLIAIKNTTADEWSLNVEDPKNTILKHYPESFLMEGAAQSAAAFFHLEFLKDKENRIVLLGKITAEFFAPVRLGSQIKYITAGYKVFKQGGFIDILVESEDIKVAEVKIFCSLFVHL